MVSPGKIQLHEMIYLVMNSRPLGTMNLLTISPLTSPLTNNNHVQFGRQKVPPFSSLLLLFSSLALSQSKRVLNTLCAPIFIDQTAVCGQIVRARTGKDVVIQSQVQDSGASTEITKTKTVVHRLRGGTK